MKAEIITIGDEILLGQTIDTNSAWLGLKLSEIGISVYQKTAISDDENHILTALKEADSVKTLFNENIAVVFQADEAIENVFAQQKLVL